MILKVGRFKSVHRYDLFLVFPCNGECLVSFSNYSKGSLIRFYRGVLCLSTLTNTKAAVSKALIGAHLELP